MSAGRQRSCLTLPLIMLTSIQFNLCQYRCPRTLMFPPKNKNYVFAPNSQFDELRICGNKIRIRVNRIRIPTFCWVVVRLFTVYTVQYMPASPSLFCSPRLASGFLLLPKQRNLSLPLSCPSHFNAFLLSLKSFTQLHCNTSVPASQYTDFGFGSSSGSGSVNKLICSLQTQKSKD